MPQDALYVLDCSYYFRASFFAIPAFPNPSGKTLNAVFGFVSTLLRLMTTYRPPKLIIAGDATGPYFRHQLFPAYKSAKVRVPQECDQQLPTLLQVLQVMGIPYVSAPGFEADDILATIANTESGAHCHVYICARDKDLQQLLSNDVSMLDIASGAKLTPDALLAMKGVCPEQVPDLLALTGDAADSIPGIPGVGEKTAVRLLAKYGSLEMILDNWEVIGGNLGSKLRDLRAQALLAKELTTLRKDVPLELLPLELRLQSVHDEVEALFQQLGFERLLKGWNKLLEACQDKEEPESPFQPDLFTE